jgi:hypothetical protein
MGSRCAALFRSSLWYALSGAALWLAQAGTSAAAQQATLEVSFVPTRAVQIAAWVERADGTFLGTLALSYATATAGIGNRPGALQMNSGYRWPYGRREGVLPVWAHRRAKAPGALQFRRVIFQDRSSEGAAARSSNDQSVDDYYCLPLDPAQSSREALDAVSCASVLASYKGRFINEADVGRGYAEPFVNERGAQTERALSLTSLYPPRRNITPCIGGDFAAGDRVCFDHVDSAEFARHARSVMPELDAITRATPPGDTRTSWRFPIPEDWSRADEYALLVEVNTEGDYNESYNAERYPAPRDEELVIWDAYAQTYGYPYRGQPSVVYRLPFRIAADASAETSRPQGYGALQGEDGSLRPIDATIRDDASGHPGSGADRLRALAGPRLQARVLLSDNCDGPNATAPSAVQDLKLAQHPDRLRAHSWAKLSFRTPSSNVPVVDYEVKVRPEGGEWTLAFTPDKVQPLRPVALDLCSDESAAQFNRCPALPPGTELSVVLAELRALTKVEVSVTPHAALCGRAGPTAYASFTTPERVFTTVSPCFIATAAYGTPLAAEIRVLRRARDRYLASHAPGRALIALYYQLGPHLAALVREHPLLRSVTRQLLEPVVTLARWLTQ